MHDLPAPTILVRLHEAPVGSAPPCRPAPRKKARGKSRPRPTSGLHPVRNPIEQTPAARRLLFLCRRQRGLCHYCGRRLTYSWPFVPAGTDATIDHVLPRAWGGTTTAGNLVASCHDCNHSKGGKLLAEWATPLGRAASSPRAFRGEG